MQKILAKLRFLFFISLSVCNFWGCATSFLRMPASVSLNYDAEHVRLLTSAAQEGILFQFDDEFLKDVPNAQISESCNHTDVEDWGGQFYSILKMFDREPDFFKKVHVIQLKRGDKPASDITRELDGTAYLILTYQKIQKRENITDEWKRKCDGFAPSRDQVVLTKMDWPSSENIKKSLEKLPNKPDIARFSFDRSFLVYLAQRKTILRITPALSAEKSFPTMQPVLPQVMNQLAQQSRQARYKYIDYYLQEIDQKSRMGGQIKFFSILQDQRLERGISLDSVSRSIASSIAQPMTSTFLFISYRSHGGNYEYSSLQDLDQCLNLFNPVSAEISYRPERFLHPGYSCGQK